MSSYGYWPLKQNLSSFFMSFNLSHPILSTLAFKPRTHHPATTPFSPTLKSIHPHPSTLIPPSTIHLSPSIHPIYFIHPSNVALKLYGVNATIIIFLFVFYCIVFYSSIFIHPSYHPSLHLIIFAERRSDMLSVFYVSDHGMAFICFAIFKPACSSTCTPLRHCVFYLCLLTICACTRMFFCVFIAPTGE